jgi:transposase InsO family protein
MYLFYPRIHMSATEHSDLYENTLAERMNRTLKEEFGLGLEHRSKCQATLASEQTVEFYNKYCPHLALQGMTPYGIHKNPQ